MLPSQDNVRAEKLLKKLSKGNTIDKIEETDRSRNKKLIQEAVTVGNGVSKIYLQR